MSEYEKPTLFKKPKPRKVRKEYSTDYYDDPLNKPMKIDEMELKKSASTGLIVLGCIAGVLLALTMFYLFTR